jgi:hypothetical protein
MNSFTALLPEIFDYFREAELAADLRQRTLSLGDRKIFITYSSEILEANLFKSFEHLESIRDNAAPSFLIFGCDGNVLSRDFPGGAHMEEFLAGDKKLLTYNAGTIHALYNADSRVFSLIDIAASRGWYYLPQASDVPYYEKAAPMRMLLHWWCEMVGWVLVHAAAVGRNSRAVLLAGRGGTGKSTTALLAAQGGFSFLGDDYVVLAKTDRLSVLSIYNSVKFKWELLQRLQSIETFSLNSPQNDEKGYFYLHQTHPDSLARTLPLTTVLLPSIEHHDKTTFIRVSSAKGLISLAASSIFQMPGSGKSTLKRLAEFLIDTPVYQMSLGIDNEEISQALKDFLASV